MSNYRTTADLLDGTLRRCGELTSSQGTSPRQTSALLYLNNIYQTIISGGNELNIDVDEPWVWSRHRHPIVLQINPSITAGTVALTYGSNAGTFSSAPVDPISGSNISVQDWLLKPTGKSEMYTISSHTSGSTSFQMDGAYPQTTGSQNFSAFQLDYDLTPSYLPVTSLNKYLDYISNSVSLTVNSATIAEGSYTPSGLATAVATALNAVADGNTYTCTYDSTQRLFTITSNLGGSNPVFRPQCAGTNYYRTAWDMLGYDYNNLTGSASYTSVYALGSVVRFSQPGRIYFGSNMWYGGGGDGQIGMLDLTAFDRQYPLIGLQQGTPDAFCVVQENRTGKVKIRLNKYLPTTQAMRIEFDYIQEARDLFNNTASIPIIPKSYRKILEYGASYYLCIDKQDTRADTYLGIAQQALKAMIKENRRELSRVGKEFGNVIARWDLMPSRSRKRLNTYGYDTLG